MAWVGDTLLALVSANELGADGLSTVVREVAVDLGTERILGSGELMQNATVIAWAPAAHRAAAVINAECYRAFENEPCFSYASNITLYEQGAASVVGRIKGIDGSFASRLPADGKVLVYMGSRVMMKAM